MQCVSIQGNAHEDNLYQQALKLDRVGVRLRGWVCLWNLRANWTAFNSTKENCSKYNCMCMLRPVFGSVVL